MTVHDTRGMDAAADAILRIEDVTKSYGPVRALRGVSLEIRRGTGARDLACHSATC